MSPELRDDQCIALAVLHATDELWIGSSYWFFGPGCVGQGMTRREAARQYVRFLNDTTALNHDTTKP